MSYNAIVAGAAFIRIAMDDASLRKGLKDAQNRVNGFVKSWEIMKSKLSLDNSNAFMYFSNAILPLSNLINHYKEFNDQILALKAISGASATQIKNLESYIRHLGSTTAFTAKEVAQGAVELSRMGFSGDEVKAGLKPALNLVRATGQETWRLGEISAYAASAVRIFGLKGKDFADVCDVMAYAANASNADIDDLGEALKIAGPSAKVVNEDLRDTAAALMLMSNAGIKGSLAGTSLRKIYQSLAAQSGKTAGLTEEQIKEGVRGIEAMQNLGVKMLDPETGNLRKAADIMSDLAKAITTMKSGEKVNFATEVFDLRGSLGALTMFNDPAALQSFRKNLDDVSGYAEKTAKEMESGIGGVTREFFSRLQDLGLTIGKMAAEVFMPIMKHGIIAFDAINKFVKENSFWFRFIGGITMGLLSLGAALKVIAVSMGIVETAFSPLLKTVKILNDFVIGLGRAKKAASGDVSQKAIQTAERFKAITKEKTDTARKAIEDIRYHEKMLNAAKEAQMGSAVKPEKIAKIQEEVEASRVKMQASSRLAAAALQRYNEALTASERVSARHVSTLGRIRVEYFKFNDMNLKRAALIWKTSVAELAASKAAVAGINKVTLAYRAKAVWAKIAAGATLSLSRALKFLAANWVTLALVAIASAYTAIASAADSAKQKIRNFNEEQSKAVQDADKELEAGDKQAKKDRAIQSRLRELEELSKQRRLTSKELSEAEGLKEEFTYGARVKINISKGTVKTIDELSFNELERSNALKRVHKDLSVIEKKLKGIEESRAKLSKDDEDDKADLRQLAEEEKEMLEKQVALRQRLKKISRGETNAVIGEETMLGGDTGAITEMNAATQKVIDAQKHILEIEQQIARFRRTAFQERMYQLDEEYKKAKESFDTVIKSEEAKIAQLKERNAELSKHRSEEDINKDLASTQELLNKKLKILQSDNYIRVKKIASKQTFNSNQEVEQITAARKQLALYDSMLKKINVSQKQYDELVAERQNARSAMEERADNLLEQKAAEATLNEYKEKLKKAQEFFDKRQQLIKDEENKQRAEIDNFLTERTNAREADEKRKGKEKIINEMLKSGDRSGAIAFIDELLAGARGVWEQATAKYKQMQEDFSSETSEGGVGYSDRELEDFRKQQELVKEAESKMLGYRDRLASAREAVDQSKVQTAGSFSLKALAAQLGSTSPAERTADATEAIQRLVKKIDKNVHETTGEVWE